MGMTKRILTLSLPALAAVAVLTSCGTPSGSFATGPGGSHETLPRVASSTTAGHCDGRLADISVDGDVTVPAGATCELVGTTVEGNVSVGHGARLYARHADVDGDIEGEGTTVVDVADDTDVGGNVQLESGATVTIRDSHVDGDLGLEDQHGVSTVTGDSVHGNVELDGNHDAVHLSHTRIGGDLSCQDNTPAPDGGGNTVSGDREDQCRSH